MKIGEFIKELGSSGEGDGSGTLILHCMPLLVVHETDGLVYSDNTDVEFKPDSPRERTGHVKALTPSEDDWYPEMTVTHRYDLPPVNYEGAMVSRGGISFVGTDSERNDFTWYMDGYADRYLMPRPQGDHFPSETP